MGALGMVAALAVPRLPAQTLSATRVYTDPPGVAFYVDGQKFSGAVSLFWPAGSKHTLSVDPVQELTTIKARYLFSGWTDSTGLLSPSSVLLVVTADPAVTYYKATFAAQYAVSLSFFRCPAANPRTCPGWPGQVQVNSIPYLADEDIYLNAGSRVTLEADPAPGYVFAGWGQALPGETQGYLASFVLTNPVYLYPTFARAQTVTLLTSPAGFRVLADRTSLTTPATLEWGLSTTHTLGVPEPQMDGYGRPWVFSSWSDQGESTHRYTMPSEGPPVSLTATFVPAGRVTFLTDPPGLKLRIDGRDNWPAYTFTWAAGAAHTVTAADQFDLTGRKFGFKSWSNGGPATQTVALSPESLATGLRLTASFQPWGTVVVDADAAGVPMQVDGSECGTPCTFQRAVGTEVRVSAPPVVNVTADLRWNFAGWLHGPQSLERTITVTAAPQALNASYTLSYRLALGSDPPHAAAWQLVPPSPDNFYAPGTQVQVMVAAQPGFKFRRWTGDASGTYRPAWIAMTAPHRVTALFDPAPYVAPNGIQNAAGVTPQNTVAPGSLASIYGASLAPEAAAGPSSPLVTALGGVTVTSAGRPLPLLFVSPSQINVQIPADMAPGEQTLRVSWNGLEVTAAFAVARNAPGLFCTFGDEPLAVALHQDGSLVTVSRPARRGEPVTLLGTGFGPYASPPQDGLAAADSETQLLVDPIEISAADHWLAPEWAGAAAGRVGLAAIRFRLPADLPGAATISLQARSNGVSSNTILLPIE